MIRVAPAMRAPCMIEMPMPPPPATSTVAPSGTLVVFSTAPTPVCTAQPITHAISSGVSSGTFTAPDAGVITSSAKPPTPTPRRIGLPVARQRRAPVVERAGHDRRDVDAAAVLAAHAPVALVARGDRAQHDPVAGRDRRHPVADRLDRARGFVTEHRRRHHRELPVLQRQVGVAEPAVAHPHEHLAGAGLFDVDVVDDFERRVRMLRSRRHA